MFILKDLFKIGSSSRSNNVSYSENLKLKKQDKLSSALNRSQFVLERNKTKKIHSWLNLDSKSKKRRDADCRSNDNKKSQHPDPKKKQYEDFRHIKPNYFREEDSISLRNMKFDDLEGLYCNREQKFEYAKNNKFNKIDGDKRRPKCFDNNSGNVKKRPLQEEFFKESSETSKEESSVDEEELTPTPESVENETEMDSHDSYSDLSDYSSTDVKTKQNKMIQKQKTPQKYVGDKKCKPESSGYKRKYDTYYVTEENQEFCGCPPKRNRNLKISSSKVQHKHKDVDYYQHKNSTSRISSTDHLGNPKISANKRVVIPKRYFENEYSKQKRIQYVLIPSGKKKSQRFSFAPGGSRTRRNRNQKYRTSSSSSSSSDISSKKDVHVNKYNKYDKYRSNTSLRRDIRKRRSIARPLNQNQNKNFNCSIRSKHPQNVGDHEQNHRDSPKRREENVLKENKKLSPGERNIKNPNSPNTKYEKEIFFENRNETQISNAGVKKYTKRKRYECKQNIFVEKGIGESYHNKKITDANEEKAILQRFIDINKEIPLNEGVTNIMKIESPAKGLKEFDHGKFQAASSPRIINKGNFDNRHKSGGKNNLINKINRLKNPKIESTELKTVRETVQNCEGNGKQRNKATNNEVSKTKKSNRNNSKCETVLENMTSDFTTTETNQKESLSLSNNIATYVLMETKEKSKSKSPNENKKRESSWDLSETKKDRNLQLFKLLEEMLGRRKARRSKSKNIHAVSAVSLAVTKKEKVIYKELHKNILKHYRASTSTSGVTFSKPNKPIDKNSGTKKNTFRKNNKKRKKISKQKLEISTLPGIEITPSTVTIGQNEIDVRKCLSNNNNCLNIDDTKNLTPIKIDNNYQKSESTKELTLEVKESLIESSTFCSALKCQSCTQTHIKDEKKPLCRSICDISKSKQISESSSVLVLKLNDSEDDIECKEWLSNKLKSSRSSRDSIIGKNDCKTLKNKIFSSAPVANPLLYPSTIKIEVKDIFPPTNRIQTEATELKAAAPITPSGDTLLFTFTDSEVWGNNVKEERNLIKEDEEEVDSNEAIEKLECSLQKSIVKDLKNCSRLSEKSISSSADSTLNTLETQRCMEEWENLVKRKVLHQLRRKVSNTYFKSEKGITVSPILTTNPIHSNNYFDNEKRKETMEEEYHANQKVTICNKSDLENKNQKSKKRSTFSMSPLETVFEAEEQPTEVIEVELLKESNSLTQMRIFENMENDLGENESDLKEFEDKISKIKNLNDLEKMEEEIKKFLGNYSLNLQISIDKNDETSLDINSTHNVKNNKPSSDGDDVSEELMSIYSFNKSKNNNENQAQNDMIEVKDNSVKVLMNPKAQEEEEFMNKFMMDEEVDECAPEDIEKNNTKTKGNKKLFSRLPVYVKKVKNINESLFSNSLEDKKDEKSTQDEGTSCDLVTTKKVDNMINTEVQEKKDQTTNYEVKLKNKQNKSVACDFHENTKRYQSLLPNKNKVKDVISNCLKKYHIVSSSKECEDNEDIGKSEKLTKKSICSDNSQFTTSTEEDSSDVDSYHSKTEKECQTTCIQNFTTDATYPDKNRRHNSLPEYSQSQKTSNCSDFTRSSKTIESESFDMSTKTYSTLNKEHDNISESESEDMPNRLISVLDEKIKKLSKQKTITKRDNSTCTDAQDDTIVFVNTQMMSDDDPFSSRRSRNTTRTGSTPQHHQNKMKPNVTYNLTKESSAFCNLRPNLNAYLGNKVDKHQSTRKSISSFQKRKLYWESVRKPEKKCTFAINTKKSRYFLMLSGKDKKNGTGKRGTVSLYDKILKSTEPKWDRPLSPKMSYSLSKSPKCISQYETPFIRCRNSVRVRHSTSLISITNKTNRDEQKRPSSADSKRAILKERLPTFYSYNFRDEDSTNNNKKSKCLLIDNDENSVCKCQRLDDQEAVTRKLECFDSDSCIKNQSNLQDFMDRTLEKQFVDKAKKRAKELFKNFMDELNYVDSFTANKIDKEKSSADLESFDEEIIIEDGDNFAAEECMSQKKEEEVNTDEEIFDQDDCFKSKSKLSTFTDYTEKNGKQYNEEMISENTSGDSNLTSLDEYENMCREFCCESSYKLNNNFCQNRITLARAEIANTDILQRFNNNGDIIKEHQSNASLNTDTKTNTIQSLESPNVNKFEFESFYGDLCNSESEIPSMVVSPKKSVRSLESKKDLYAESFANDQNILSENIFENEESNSRSLTEREIKGRTQTGEAGKNQSKPSVKCSSNPLITFKPINQKSFDSFNGEAFRQSENSYFSSDNETVKNQSENKNCSGSESNENYSKTDISISQTNSHYLIIQDCFISDEDRLLQDFTETSSFDTDICLVRKNENDVSNSSATFSHDAVLHDNISINAELYNPAILEKTEKDDNNVSEISNDSYYINLLNPIDFESYNFSQEETFLKTNEDITENQNVEPSAEECQSSVSIKNQDNYPNSKSGDAINAIKIYESPVDPLFSSIRVYHEKIFTDVNEREYSTPSTNDPNNTNKDNNCSDEATLDEYAMTLISYESSPNLCSNQNQNQDFGETIKLSPEEIDSGFESAKQRFLIKTVSTSDLQDLNTSFNTIQGSRSSHSMLNSVSSCSVTKNFFHNVTRKNCKKKVSLTALSRALQLQRRSSVHLNQSFHWKEFWKNVHQIKDNPSTGIMSDDVSKGDMEKRNEIFTDEKQLFFDSLKHLQDFHFENTYLSYSLFEVDKDPNLKRFPTEKKEGGGKATQTKNDVYYIPYVSVMATPASSIPCALNFPKERSCCPNTSKNNSHADRISVRSDKGKPQDTKKEPQKNEANHLDLEETHGRRPNRKKRYKRHDTDFCDTMSVDDSGCGTYSSEKSYKIPKRLSMETFQEPEINTSGSAEFEENLASIEECRSSYQYLVPSSTKDDPHLSLDTSSNVEDGPLSTSKNEGASTSWRMRHNISKTRDEPSSSSSTLVNKCSVGKRKLRKKITKNQEKNNVTPDDYNSSDSNEENEDQSQCNNLSTQENYMRLQRPLLTFVKKTDDVKKLKKENKDDDSSKGIEPKGPSNGIQNFLDLSKIPQPKINIIADSQKQPTLVLQNEVQPCNCIKKMLEVANPQTQDEIEKIHKLYEVVGCSCGSKRVTDKKGTGHVEIEEELGPDTHIKNEGSLLYAISEAHLRNRSSEFGVFEEEVQKQAEKAADVEEKTTNIVDYEKNIYKNDKKKIPSHCLLSETELLKRQKHKKHEIRSSLTDKEIFEKLLENYEKEDKLIKKLSQDGDFFEAQLKASSEDMNESKMNIVILDNNEAEANKNKNFEETKSKTSKKDVPSERKRGDNLRFSISSDKDSESLHMTESQNRMNQRRTRFFGKKKAETNKSLTKRSSILIVETETDKEVTRNRKTKLVDKVSYTSSEDPMRIKKAEAKTVTEEDIIKSKELGKCFRRGFRPDSTTLSGEPCLSLSPEEEVARLNTLQARKDSMIEFSERGSPLDYLLSLGFSIDEASNAIKDEDVKHRLYAAITEARIWVNHINANQGTLLYLAAYKTKPNTMRYFLQLIEAIINGRINDAVKLDAFIKLLEKVESGEISIVKILGFDQFEDEINEEIILRKQLRQLFVTIFKAAEKEAKLKGMELDKDTIELLRILAARYRAGLHPHLELIARYIGQGLLVNEIQLEAAMIYLSRLDTADVNLSQFEKYCSITCGKDTNK